MTEEAAKIVERMQAEAEKRESAQIIQLPLWPEVRRGTPNSFIRSALFPAIQGKDRQYLQEETLFSQQGITVKFTGKQFNQEDLTLWETLVHLARNSPLGNTCSFTAHGILRALGLNTGGREHRRLHSAITRLMACAVEINHEGKFYIGNLVENARGRDELTGEPTKHYQVRLNRDLIRLYGETQWTAIDWEQRLKLRRKPLAQALHAYYSSHRTPFPVKLATLQRLTGSKNVQAASFKRQCVAALDELVEIGFLKSFRIEGDTVTVSRQAVLGRSE